MFAKLSEKTGKVCVFETPFGDVLCGFCGHELEPDDDGNMPERCHECMCKPEYYKEESK